MGQLISSGRNTTLVAANDDCPEYRMVIGVRDRDGKRAAKADAKLRTLEANSVAAISVHVAAFPTTVRTFRSCPFRSSSDHLCVG